MGGSSDARVGRVGRTQVRGTGLQAGVGVHAGAGVVHAPGCVHGKGADWEGRHA